MIMNRHYVFQINKTLEKKSEQENILFEEDVFDQSDLSQEIEG